MSNLPYNPNPPSTARICPVTNPGPVAKNSTASATSSAVPFRFIGVFAANRSAAPPAESPISIHPGATQFTLTSGANAFAIACVNICTAAFELQ